MSTVAAARANFPRCLEQPPGSYRFGADALLLAAFAGVCLPPSPRHWQVAELGSGCGAALLALGLHCQDLTGYGLEREPELHAAAGRNAARLGLAERLHFHCIDLAAINSLPLPENSWDLVLANPPYRSAGQGRPSPKPLRERALGSSPDEADALPMFCAAAARLLRHHGRFCCIFAAEALPRLCAALEAAGFGVRRILPLSPYTHAPATRILTESRKNAASELRLESPLALHPRRNSRTSAGRPLWTRRALRFCPWLDTSAQSGAST